MVLHFHYSLFRYGFHFIYPGFCPYWTYEGINVIHQFWKIISHYLFKYCIFSISLYHFLLECLLEIQVVFYPPYLLRFSFFFDGYVFIEFFFGSFKNILVCFSYDRCFIVASLLFEIYNHSKHSYFLVIFRLFYLSKTG